MSATNDLLSTYQHVISETSILHGGKGMFDVKVNGEMLYSKDETGRHAEEGEILELFKNKYGEGIRPFGT